MSKVQEILRLKKRAITENKQRIKLSDVPNDDRRICWHPGRFNIIAEMKRSSPSAGPLRENLDLRKIVQGYERAGVSAVSVLTEEHFFGGSLKDLALAKKAAKKVPILQKDFILDESQIYEAKMYGADFILLIVRFLSGSEVNRFAHIAD